MYLLNNNNYCCVKCKELLHVYYFKECAKYKICYYN